MFAYVKYRDNYRAVLPVRLIKGFNPKDDNDFLKTREVQAHWSSEDGTTEGYYPAFVHALADTPEALNVKMKKMREPFPRIINVPNEEPPSRKRKMEQTKKDFRRQNVAATQALHERILDQNTPQGPQEGGHENLAEEVKKLKRELKACREQNKRLTNALLDKIEIAREEGLQDSGTMARTSIGCQTDVSELGPLIVPNEVPLNSPAETADGTANQTLFDEGPYEASEGGTAGTTEHEGGPAKMARLSEPPASVCTEAGDGSQGMDVRAETTSSSSQGLASPAGELFPVVDGQVRLGMGYAMPALKWQFVMTASSDAKCTLDVARHLWPTAEAAQRSLTGQACRTLENSTVKAPATPEKVDVVKSCLQRYVDIHPMGPPAPPPESRVAAVRKYLRAYFTEAGRVGKRVRSSKKAPV